jgi:hypothetical protein
MLVVAFRLLVQLLELPHVDVRCGGAPPFQPASYWLNHARAQPAWLVGQTGLAWVRV